MRTVASYVWFAVSLILKLPAYFKMKRLRGTRPDAVQAEDVHNRVNGWANSLIKVTGARLHVSGAENIPRHRAALFVSNHQSDFDIVVFLSAIPVPIGFVAKIELLKVPLLRAWMKLMRCVFMDRKDMRQSAKTILEGIDILKSGHSMVVFPEGTRSRTGEPLPFKAGSLKLATKSKAVIVPTTVNGSYKTLEGNHYKVKPADIYLTFHPPVYVDDLDAEALKKLPEEVERTVVAGLGAVYQ
ncbi:MAG: 1-acyl-sn-glycerol-3-phosphate acyltransferase [Clostridiales bacterium]|jgi:1-acyl-sn-glycerol-3-phosphate acyltransferase|nr:1-acyl-sn-glycerol-3-phosphate acyltransferase [Clostridiales bacterium]